MLKLVIAFTLSIFVLIGHCQTNEGDPIVIEGTIISPVRSYSIKVDSNDYHGSIFSSRLVEVNRVFNGAIKEKIIEVVYGGGTVGNITSHISHGQQSLPHEGTTAIIRLVDQEKRKAGIVLQGLSPYPVHFFSSVKTVFRQGQNSDHYSQNVEEEIYQALEEEFGQPRTNIQAPATKNAIATNHCVNNLLPAPNRQTGLVYSLSKNWQIENPNLVGFEVKMSSSNSAVYLSEAELIIEYNTKAFGDSIVLNGNLISLSIPNHFDLADFFDIHVRDIAVNRFKINWTSKPDLEHLMQLLPQSYRAASIILDPINRKERTGIKLIAEASSNKYFDQESEMISPFEYVATENEGYIFGPKVIDWMPLIISDVSPNQKLQPGSKITIRGENFTDKTKVYLNAQSPSGYYRPKQVASRYIESRSDTCIVLIIPKMLLPDEDLPSIKEWYTNSGKVSLTKGYKSFQQRAYSSTKLEIENDVDLPDRLKMIEEMKQKSK